MTDVIDFETRKAYSPKDCTLNHDVKREYQRDHVPTPAPLTLPPAPHPETLTEFRYSNLLSIRDAAALCDVTTKTWQRWEAGKSKMPRPTWAWLNVMKNGVAASGGKDWKGWSIWKGYLCSPEGYQFTSGEVRAIPARYSCTHELERRVKQLQEELTAYRNTPSWRDKALGQLDLVGQVLSQLMFEYEEADTPQLNHLSKDVHDLITQAIQLRVTLMGATRG